MDITKRTLRDICRAGILHLYDIRKCYDTASLSLKVVLGRTRAEVDSSEVFAADRPPRGHH